MHLLRTLHQKLDKNEASASVRSSVSTDSSMLPETSNKEKRQSQRQYAHVMIPVEIVQENSSSNHNASHNGESFFRHMSWAKLTDVAADMCFGSCCRN